MTISDAITARPERADDVGRAASRVRRSSPAPGRPSARRWTTAFLGALFAACLASGHALSAERQTLDRVVASVGGTAITASDVEREYRFERFLDAQWPPPAPDAATLAEVRQRLTYQLLLAEEESPAPAEKTAAEQAAAERLAALRKGFAHPEGFAAALQALGMTEAEVLAHLTRQEVTLRLINLRLRTEASPSEEDVASYYRATFLPAFRQANPKAAEPPLADVADSIREILVQQRINELLDQWIEELSPTRHVRVHNF